ncbi:hypothetical protein AMJ57_01480 [Parcubacteria bacterium SG8_24]|nr:MAG: hypothetical protein AMJ57_01480 [Parcubacteria bacterium SG8_24]
MLRFILGQLKNVGEGGPFGESPSTDTNCSVRLCLMLADDAPELIVGRCKRRCVPVPPRRRYRIDRDENGRFVIVRLY